MSKREIVRIRDVMKPKFDIVDGMSTVADALKTMVYKESRALIVSKRHSDDELGILLLSEIARQVLAADRSPERVNVYEVMAKPVIHVTPEMDIRYCARLFTRFHIHLAPVVENGEPVGIVSLTDLVLKGMCRDIL